MVSNLLSDAGGKKSSKRIWGSIMLGGGLALSIILFSFSLTQGAKDAQTATSIINMLLLAGSSLLGLGVFEKGNKRAAKNGNQK